MSGSVLKCRFHIGYALIGIALPNAESFLANEVCLEMQQLLGWLGTTGFERPIATAAAEFTIQYRRPASAVFAVNADLDVGVRFRCALNEGAGSQRIEETPVFAFISNIGLPLNRWFELINALRLLLNLASLKPVYPVKISAFQDDHGQQVGDRRVRQEIEIWTSLIRESMSEPGLPELWLFRFDDFRSRFGAFLSNWLALTVKYAEALGCYSPTAYASLTAELTHLSLTQALEAYHGVKFQSHKGKTFGAKIEELARTHISSLQGLVDRPADFAETVRVTRNYYTHHSPSTKHTGKVAGRSDLIRLNEKLLLIFQMCVLSDLGVPVDRFPRLRRQLAKEIIEYR